MVAQVQAALPPLSAPQVPLIQICREMILLWLISLIQVCSEMIPPQMTQVPVGCKIVSLIQVGCEMIP